MTLAKIEFNENFNLTNEEKNQVLQSAEENMLQEAFATFKNDFNSNVLPVNFGLEAFKSVDNAKEFVAAVYENFGVGAAHSLYDHINYSVA